MKSERVALSSRPLGYMKSLWREVRDVPLRYNWTLHNLPNVIHCGSRAYCRILRDGQIRKIYCRNKVARNAYARELQFARRFQRFSWSTPVLNSGVTWLQQPWFDIAAWPQERRLDRYAISASPRRRDEFMKQILSAILDLHCQGVAHRDIHARNIFCLDDGVRLIDYDSAIDYPEGYRPRFSDCYDLTGEGLESPFRSNNACMFASHFPYALGRIIEIDRGALLADLRRDTESEMHELSIDRSRALWRFDGEILRSMPDGSFPCPASEETVATIYGSRCGGAVRALRERGYRTIRVYERDPHTTHVLRRWLEVNGIDGVVMGDDDGDDRSITAKVGKDDIVLSFDPILR